MTEKKEAWTSDYVTLGDGTKLGYFQNGDGHEKTVLFLNGALGSGGADSCLFLINFASHVNCISIDMRGYGLSKNADRMFSVNQFHQDATDAAEVMKILGIPRYSVYGMSDGGDIGIILAAQDSNCVENLIVTGAIPYLTKDNLAAYKEMADLTTWHPKAIEPKLNCYGREKTIELLRKVHESFVEIFDTRSGEICVSESKRVTCPVLIIHLELDDFHGSMDQSRSLADNIPNSTLHVFHDMDYGTLVMSHFLELQKLMIDFIK